MKFYSRTCSLKLALVQKFPEETKLITDVVDKAVELFDNENGTLRELSKFSPKVTKSIRFSEHALKRICEIASEGDMNFSETVSIILENYIIKQEEENGQKVN